MSRLSFWIRIAICVLFIFLPLDSLDQWIYDNFFVLRGATRQATEIVIIKLDQPHSQTSSDYNTTFRKEGSLAETGPLALSQQRYYEKALKQILQGLPKLIILTTFPELEHPFIQDVLENEKIIFPAIVNDENKLVLPASSLPSGQNYGFSNIFPDSDNVVRKTLLAYSSSTSLALRARMKVNTAPIETDVLEPLWIDFRGPMNSYPIYTAKDLNDPNQIGKWRDKIIVAGTDDNIRTLFETPFGPLSRLEIHANIIDTYLSGRQIQKLPHYSSMIYAAFSIAVAATIIIAMPLTVAWILLLIFAGLCFLIPLFIFSQFKIWIGIANPIFSIFSSHLLILGFKLSREEEHQWKLKQETQYLKELDQFKNNFISLFSHDLKTPIAKIRAITERIIAENKNLPMHVKESLKTIDRTNDDLARLISDILKVTQMETRPLKKKLQVIDFNRIVEQNVEQLQYLAQDKNIRLTLDLEPLFAMEADPVLLTEVIANLIENAIKYSPQGSTVIVRTVESNGFVEFSVIDEGPGIPPDELAQVTTKFYRCKRAQETTKGSGLGLYLSKYFVELHHGRLALESTVGVGTTAKISLPITG